MLGNYQDMCRVTNMQKSSDITTRDSRFRGSLSAVNYRNCTLSRIWFHGVSRGPNDSGKRVRFTLLRSRAAAKRESRRFIPTHKEARNTQRLYVRWMRSRGHRYMYTRLREGTCGQMPEWKSSFGKAAHVAAGNRGDRRLAWQWSPPGDCASH